MRRIVCTQNLEMSYVPLTF